MNKLTTLRQLVTLLGAIQTLRFLFVRLSGAPAIAVHLKDSDAPLIIRFNNSDLVLLLGVFLHHDCHLSLCPPPELILDLGANTGLTARAFAGQFPSARIVAVEPDMETYQYCGKNTASHQRILCLNRIIGPVAGFGAIANPEALSMARQFVVQPSGTTEGIRISTIEELLDAHPVSGPVLVKMDIEGAEIPLFTKPGTWLNRVQAVLVEPHGDGTAALIERTLILHGFSLHVIGEKILGLKSPWIAPPRNYTQP